MPWVGFEFTIPVFKLAKTFSALDRTATVTGLTTVNKPIVDIIIYNEQYNQQVVM
jgi:hypothetical protein